MPDDDLTPGHQLDGNEFRQGHLYENGAPPVFDPWMVYGFEFDEVTQQLAMVPVRPRVIKPVSFKNLNAEGKAT
jgi:hypothetical protein